jgi:tetratricopeptide (TPR) repeat protein
MTNMPPKDFYSVAYALCESGQYRKAQPIVEQFLASEPDSWRGWCVASWAATSIGDATAGLDYAARGMSLAPEKSWPVRSYAIALRALGRHGLALEFARKSVELDPLEVLSWRCVAESARHFGLTEEAVEAATRATEVAPDNTHAMRAWVAAARLIDRSEGIEIMLRALESEPNASILLRELAILYSYEGRYAEAKDLFERVLKLQPRDRGARGWLLAVIGAQEGQSSALPLMRDYFEQELRSSSLETKSQPSDFRPHIRSAFNARRLGFHEKALAFAREATLHPPAEQFVGVWRVLAQSACAMRQWELAKFAIDRAYELDPSDAFRWLEVAEVALLAGETDRASEWAQRVLDRQPSCIFAMRAHAIVALCRGDLEEASARLRECLQMFPFHACCAAQLAYCRAEVGDHNGALDAWGRSTDQEPFCSCEWRQRAESSMTRVGIEVESQR